MTKNELIERLAALEVRNNWDDGMGACSVYDFLQIPQSVRSDEKIMHQLWRTVENRNSTELERAGNNVDIDSLDDGETWENHVWEMWTNCDLEFNYDDIQALVNQFEETDNA